LFERAAFAYLDLATPVPDQTCILQLTRYQSDCRSFHARNTREVFMCKGKPFAPSHQIVGLQQPANQTLFCLVQKIAGRNLLHLREKRLLMSNNVAAYQRICSHELLELARRDIQTFTMAQNAGPAGRVPPWETARQSNGGKPPDQGRLEAHAIPHDSDQ
jgi:hypothetical protein